MFTGLITDLGAVRAVEENGDTRFVLETGYDTGELDIGSSVACSGVCLTVVDKGPGWFAVQASGETLARTTLGEWRPGTPVNFERPVKAGGELGGHLVSGHVDGLARLSSLSPEGESLRLVFDTRPSLARFIAAKGSVALDGVSLTVNEVDGNRFSINVIPHTRECTTLGTLTPGDRVNLEVDMLARYVDRLLQAAADD